MEGLPKDPINPYGATKLFFERVLAAYGTSHGLRYAALRYFNAAGGSPDDGIGEIHDPETHIIPLTLQAALGTGPKLQVFGSSLPTPDGTCIRDFVHVKDLARAHAMAAEHLMNERESITLNLGTGQGTSIKQLMSAVERVTGRKVPHECVEPRAGDPPILYADPSRAERTLGWKTRLGIQEIVEDAYAWELKREDLLMEYEAGTLDQKQAVGVL
jgi:UDP-glucose 4-epimerase